MHINDLFQKEHLRKFIYKRNLLSDKINKSLPTGLTCYNPNTYKEDYSRLSKIPKKNGKLREIYIYPMIDRLRQKAVLDYLYTNHNNFIHPQVYSYKEGISIEKPIRKVAKLQKEHDLYWIAIDLSDFFNTTPIELIKRTIDTVTKNSNCKGLREYLYSVFERNKCYIKTEQKSTYRTYNLEKIDMTPSLQAGSPLSAFFANAVLFPVDTLIADKEKIMWYSRYGDDILLLDSNKQKLEQTYNTLLEEVNKLGLKINEKKTQRGTTYDSINYLGAKIHPNGSIDIGDDNFKRIKREVKQICKKARKTYELQTKHNKEQPQQPPKTPEELTQETIKKIQQILLKGVVDKKYNKQDRRDVIVLYSRILKILNLITQTDRLKELNQYILQQLRYTYTGKNNSANYKKLPNEKIYDLGWINLEKLYKIRQNNKNDYLSIILNIY